MRNKRLFIVIMFVALSIGILISKSFAYFSFLTKEDNPIESKLLIGNDNIKVIYPVNGKINIEGTIKENQTISRNVIVYNTKSEGYSPVDTMIDVDIYGAINNFSDKTKLNYKIKCTSYSDYDKKIVSENELCANMNVTSDNITKYNSKILAGNVNVYEITLYTSPDYIYSDGDEFSGNIIVRRN